MLKGYRVMNALNLDLLNKKIQTIGNSDCYNMITDVHVCL